MSKFLVEIRAAEGGLDSKILVKRQLGIYVNTCKKHGL